MSSGAVRPSSSRRHIRDNNASPYARPTGKKANAGWSVTGFLSYLNPLRFTAPREDLPTSQGDAAARLAARGEELQSEAVESPLSKPSSPGPSCQQQPQPPTPPAQSASQSPPASADNHDHRTSPRSDDSHMSSSANLQKVQDFLHEKAGRPLNHIELAGIVHLLQNSVEDDDERPEPFRFSRSPSTRGNTPAPNFPSTGSAEPLGSASTNTTPGTRKTLAKNPMGVYRWQGGGSARPRNRYHSPGFGSAPSRPTMKIVTEKPKADSKRRRVGDDAASTTTERVGSTVNDGSQPTPISASVSAPAALSGTGSTANTRANGLAPPSTPRIRTNGLKPTVPAVPSPLRQTWGQTDSPPQRASPPQPAAKPTRAASFMTELIKEVTPPKKPAFANPYEAANPMIRPLPKKQPVRKTRAATKANAKEEQKKEQELTPQAIIEATVPKGSKRSRPPPELIGAKSPEKNVSSGGTSAPRRSTRINGADPAARDAQTTKATVQEVSDEELPSPPKKQRTVKSPPHKPAIIVEEIDDVEMSSTPASKPGPKPSYATPSEVIEPSDDKTEKKRATSPTSVHPNLPRSGSFQMKSSAPKAPSKLRFSIQAEKEESSPTLTPAPVTTAAEKPKDALAFVKAMKEDALPKYDFALPMSSPGAGPSTIKARQAALEAPASSLPTFDFSKASAPVAAPAPAPAPSAPASGGFNWAAAGVKPPPKPTGNTWSCSDCMLSNPAAADKCTVCEAPRPGAAKAAPPAQGFNWAAAGAKPPPQAGGGQWTCGTCMLKNPVDASKCTVCDTPR